MNEHEIQNRLWKWRNQNHRFIVPNVYMGWGESDLLTVTKSGFVYDHEIKISRRDFNADAKTKMVKHACLEKRLADLPNYFVFVVPSGMITAAEVPNYAGLVYVGKGVTIVKPPPLLHKSKVSDATIASLCTKLMWRYWRGRLNEPVRDRRDNEKEP